MRKQVEIFTDGSCLGNPGPGGYGAIMRYRQHEKTFSEGYFLTTNNRMELMAAIVALEALKEHCDVVLSTDSQYVRQGITQWIHNWKKRGWKTADKKPVKNVDLWKRLDAALGQHQIKWEWVKGHAGHPENERCDELARAAASNPAHEDAGYLIGFFVLPRGADGLANGRFRLALLHRVKRKGNSSLTRNDKLQTAQCGEMGAQYHASLPRPGQHLKTSVAEHFKVQQ